MLGLGPSPGGDVGLGIVGSGTRVGAGPAGVADGAGDGVRLSVGNGGSDALGKETAGEAYGDAAVGLGLPLGPAVGAMVGATLRSMAVRKSAANAARTMTARPATLRRVVVFMSFGA